MGFYAGLNGSVADTDGGATASFTTTRTIEKGELVVAAVNGGSLLTAVAATVGSLTLQPLASNITSSTRHVVMGAVALAEIASGATASFTANTTLNPFNAVSFSLGGVALPTTYSTTGNSTGVTSADAGWLSYGAVQVGVLSLASSVPISPNSGETEIFESSDNQVQVQYALVGETRAAPPNTVSWTWGSTADYATTQLAFPALVRELDRSRFPKPPLRFLVPRPRKR